MRYLLVLCLSLAAFATSFAQSPTDVLATANSHTFKASDLSPEAVNAVTRLPQMIANLRKELISQKIGNLLLQAESKVKGTTVAQLLKQQTAVVKDPTAAEIQAVYDANKGSIGNRPLAEVKDQIVEYLRREPENKAVQAFVDTLAVKHKLTLGKDPNAPDLKPTDAIFSTPTVTYTAKQFEDDAKLIVYGARADFYDDLKAELEQTIFNTLLADEAKSLKIEPGDLIAREVTAKLKDYTDAERGALESGLKDRLFTKYGVKILLAEPTPVAQNISVDDDPSKGPAAAPVTVVMFSDFQCSACAATHPVLSSVIAGYPGQVKLVVRDFPIESLHPNAFNAAKAAAAANAQGKFFEFTEILYKRQDALDVPSLRKYAAEVGLNVKQFELDFNSEKTSAEIRKDMADGVSYGVGGTPTIFVNGVAVRTLSADAFRKAIDRALRK
jgi:protein-disulfide isomerase